MALRAKVAENWSRGLTVDYKALFCWNNITFSPTMADSAPDVMDCQLLAKIMTNDKNAYLI